MSDMSLAEIGQAAYAFHLGRIQSVVQTLREGRLSKLEWLTLQHLANASDEEIIQAWRDRKKCGAL